MKKINCKHGLNNRQELEARRLRKKLLSEVERKEVFLEIRKIFEQYNYTTTFEAYLKEVNPSLYSACARVDIRFSSIDRKLIINI